MTIAEIEYVFLHNPAIAPDISHSQGEYRFQAIGKTKTERYIFIVFTFRQGEIRPISARYMHQKEVNFFEKANPNI